MYKQLCRNLKNYIEINKSEDQNDLRQNIAIELCEITDIDDYKKLEKINSEKQERIDSFILLLKKHSNSYPKFKKLVWEMWAYGFNPDKGLSTYEFKYVDEKLKLIDLLLGTHYN